MLDTVGMVLYYIVVVAVIVWLNWIYFKDLKEEQKGINKKDG